MPWIRSCSMMKNLRKKLSKKLEVPPFVIFQDPSLEAMATTYPVTLRMSCRIYLELVLERLSVMDKRICHAY